MQHDVSRQRDQGTHDLRSRDTADAPAVGKKASHYDALEDIQLELVDRHEEDLGEDRDADREELGRDRGARSAKRSGNDGSPREADHGSAGAHHYGGLSPTFKTRKKKVTDRVRLKTGMAIKSAIGTSTVSATFRYNQRDGWAKFDANTSTHNLSTDWSDELLGYELVEDPSKAWGDHEERDGHPDGLHVWRYGCKITFSPLKLPIAKHTQKRFVHWVAGKYTGKSDAGYYKRK